LVCFSYRFDGGEVTAMGSLVEELELRERAVRSRLDELRRQIELLAEQVAEAEERLSRLLITRETVEEVLAESGTTAVPDSVADTGTGGDPTGAGYGPVIGVLTVPPWRPGLDASVLPQSYRDVLEVLRDAGRPLRAKQIAPALGMSVDASKVEGLRSKLKRLVGRDWLTERVPGMFALPVRPNAEDVSKPAG
jgi:hypothetical protein